jgi:GNAT superfamily N-acetyltransferase
MIINAGTEQLKRIVELHKLSGVEGILGKIDPAILLKNFYAPFIAKSNTTHLLVLSQDNLQLEEGYLAYRSNIYTNRLRLPNIDVSIVINLIKIILHNPAVIVKIMLVYMSEIEINRKMKDLHEEYDEIQILVVNKSMQNKGLGSELMKYILNANSERNIIVKTQSLNNLDFYSRFGFCLFNTSKMFKSRVYTMIRMAAN